MFKAKSERDQDAGARPGAARVLPMRLVSRVPVLGRFARPPAPPPKKMGLLSARRLMSLLRRPKPVPRASSRLRIPFVAPVIRGVRQPIQRTAAVVRAARDIRKPRTRWERLREAARMAMDDPVDGTRWERLMGLGVGLVAGGRHAAPPKAAEQPQRRKRLPRLRKPRPVVVEARKELGLRASLRRLQALLNENAGPGQRRDRREIEAPKRTR